MKKLISILLVLALVFALCGCSAKEETGEVNITVLSGPTGIGALALLDEAENGSAKNTYNFNIAATNDEVVAAVSSGSTDIAAIATNMAASLYAKTAGEVTLLAVNTLGVLHLLSNGEEIASVADLKGKTIYATGQGANPEYILNYVLSGNSLKAGEDVTVKFVTDGTELLTVWTIDPEAVIMAPEPLATTLQIKNENAKRIFSMTDEWKKVSGGTDLMMGCVIVNNKFLSENEGVVKTFLKEYETSINAVKADPEKYAASAVKRGIIANEAVAKKAIPNCGLTFITAKDAYDSLINYYVTLFEYNPKSVGGTVPVDNFYYGYVKE